MHDSDATTRSHRSHHPIYTSTRPTSDQKAPNARTRGHTHTYLLRSAFIYTCGHPNRTTSHTQPRYVYKSEIIYKPTRGTSTTTPPLIANHMIAIVARFERDGEWEKYSISSVFIQQLNRSLYASHHIHELLHYFIYVFVYDSDSCVCVCMYVYAIPIISNGMGMGLMCVPVLCVLIRRPHDIGFAKQTSTIGLDTQKNMGRLCYLYLHRQMHTNWRGQLH